MSFTPGNALGPYELLTPLGAGGMGEVWRARDSKLGREVAVKVLPEAFGTDADRLARFQQEAKVLAALSHPNILTIFEFGVHEGSPFLVMELLEGETLRERLVGRPMSPRRAVELALQVANGLAAAHEQGIIHRDLKPENLFLTKDGRVKLLDFGLAKLRPQAAGSQVETQGFLSEPGTVVGTSGYMSPEQVQGGEVDARSDLFSLGVMLWEMLAGRAPFHRESALETMHAILKEEPPDLDPELRIPSALEHILDSCLAKDPSARFHSAHDLAFALERETSHSHSESLVRREVPSRGVARPLVSISVLLAIALLALLAGRAWHPVLQLPTISQVSFHDGEVYGARFSADGLEIIHDVVRAGQAPNLFSIRLESQEVQRVPLEGVCLLAVSKTGALAVQGASTRDLPYVNFLRGTLAITEGRRTVPRDIASDVVSADLSPSGELAVVRYLEGRYRLELPPGRVRLDQPTAIGSPRVSPDGRFLAFQEQGRDGSYASRIGILDLATGQLRLFPENWAITGLAWWNGELWFCDGATGRTSTLRAVNVQGRHRDLLPLPGMGWRVMDISRAGKVLLAKDEMEFRIRVWADGANGDWVDHRGFSILCDLSASGKSLAMVDTDVQSDSGYRIYLRALEAPGPVFIGEGVIPALSPDGRWIATFLRGDPPKVAILPTGQGEAQQIPISRLSRLLLLQWTRDGEALLLAGAEGNRPPPNLVVAPSRW